jgi:hypothetical protein
MQQCRCQALPYLNRPLIRRPPRMGIVVAVLRCRSDCTDVMEVFVRMVWCRRSVQFAVAVVHTRPIRSTDFTSHASTTERSFTYRFGSMETCLSGETHDAILD